MKFTFACKKISLNDSIKEYAEKKISKLDKYFPEEADACVTFAAEKKNRCVAELTIRSANGTLFRAQTEDPDGDMRGAIDEAVSFIDRRIRKNKTRLAKNLRADALVSSVPAEFDVVEDNDFDVIRTERFAVKLPAALFQFAHGERNEHPPADEKPAEIELDRVELSGDQLQRDLHAGKQQRENNRAHPLDSRPEGCLAAHLDAPRLLRMLDLGKIRLYVRDVAQRDGNGVAHVVADTHAI